MPRGAKLDWEATKAAKFLDKRSFVSLKGDVYLRGKDMEAQRKKVWERSKHRCEQVLDDRDKDFVVVCARHIWWETFHMHHIVHRGKGGSDNLANLAAWCAECHLRHHGQIK